MKENFDLACEVIGSILLLVMIYAYTIIFMVM